MTNYTAETLREEIAELHRRLNLLNDFKSASISAIVCDDEAHEWRIQGWNVHDEESVDNPENVVFWADWVCNKCGVVLTRTYKQPDTESTTDRWHELRIKEDEKETRGEEE